MSKLDALLENLMGDWQRNQEISLKEAKDSIKFVFEQAMSETWQSMNNDEKGNAYIYRDILSTKVDEL